MSDLLSARFHRIQRRHKEAMAKRQDREGGGEESALEKAERIRAKVGDSTSSVVLK